MHRPLAVLLLAGLLLLSACRVERRARADDAGEPGGSDTTATLPARPAVEDSVRSVVSALHDALRDGDGARVGMLSAPGALLVDQEEGVRWRKIAGSQGAGGTGAGEGPLPGVLQGADDGLGWVRVRSDFVDLGSAALLVDHYRATVSGEEVPWTAVETHVLVRTGGGWRLRHLHRSRGLGREAGE